MIKDFLIPCYYAEFKTRKWQKVMKKERSENMPDKFILHSNYKPTGDQPQAIEKLTEGIKMA